MQGTDSLHLLCCCPCLQVIELPLKHPELFESLGIAQPKVWVAAAGMLAITNNSSSSSSGTPTFHVAEQHSTRAATEAASVLAALCSTVRCHCRERGTLPAETLQPQVCSFAVLQQRELVTNSMAFRTWTMHCSPGRQGVWHSLLCRPSYH